MKAFVIYQKGNARSEQSVNELSKSIYRYNSDIELEKFPSTTPNTLKEDMVEEFEGLEYTYPKQGEMRNHDISGMVLTGYHAKDVQKKIACTISHARLWKKCLELKEEIMILEHDAIFTRKFEPFNYEGFICGLNDPRGATRRSDVFHRQASSTQGVSNCPWVDNEHVPQGLAGNSAYLIKPFGASWLISKLQQEGIWPNDALMCKQICPWLNVVYPYYTTVQAIGSFTTI